MLRHLEENGWAVGLDFSPLAIEFSRRRGARRLVRADVQAMPIADEAFDVVTALDLTEHVERDDLVFSEILRILKPEGRLVLTVPAHPSLWSDHDDALFHCRRYTRAALEQKMQAAGFGIERLSFCITFTSPLIVGFRLLQRLFQKPDHPKSHLILLPPWANRLLTLSVRFEAFLLKWFDLPFGITLLAVARKKSR
jgi:SAM-dependent methyltransferase